MSEELPPQAAGWEPLLPWQQATAATLLADRERWPHALLLAGRSGVGKRVLALNFARALLCERPQSDGGACGACPSCAYVVAGAHPDLRLLERLEFDDEDRAVAVDAITVDRIRDLIAFAQLTSHRQGPKLALVCPAEAMNAQAANALLKTLEEPPANMYLILVSHQPGRVPATIVSRCRRLRAPEADPATATAWLAKHASEQPERLLAQAGGAPLLALALADPVVQREREVLLAELARPERFSPLALGARLEAAARDERKTRLGEALYWLLTWTADLAAVASGGAPRFNPERREALSRLSAQVARVPLFRYYQALLRQRALLNHPLQPRLVAEALLFEYRGLFAKGKS